MISDRYTRGHSSPCTTFDNAILCGNTDDEKYKGLDDSTFAFTQAETSKGNFVVVEMEIWGFE